MGVGSWRARSMGGRAAREDSAWGQGLREVGAWSRTRGGAARDGRDWDCTWGRGLGGWGRGLGRERHLGPWRGHRRGCRAAWDCIWGWSQCRGAGHRRMGAWPRTRRDGWAPGVVLWAWPDSLRKLGLAGGWPGNGAWPHLGAAGRGLRPPAAAGSPGAPRCIRWGGPRGGLRAPLGGEGGRGQAGPGATPPSVTPSRLPTPHSCVLGPPLWLISPP